MKTNKRYFKVYWSMPGYLDRSDDIICYDIKDLRHELASQRDEYERNEYDVINPVNDIISHAYDSAQYIMAKNGSWVVYVERVYVTEFDHYESKPLIDLSSSEYTFVHTDFEIHHYAYEYAKTAIPVFGNTSKVTGVVLKNGNAEILEVWATECSRPFENYAEYTRIS